MSKREVWLPVFPAPWLSENQRRGRSQHLKAAEACPLVSYREDSLGKEAAGVMDIRQKQ